VTPPLRFDQLDPRSQAAIRKNLDVLQQKGASDDEIEAYLQHDENLVPVTGTPAPANGDRILRNITALRQQAASEHDIETYLTEHEHLTPTGSASDDGGFRGHGAGRDFGQEERRSGMLQAALDAVPFATKGMAAIDAMRPRGLSYGQSLLNRKAGLAGFRAEHPKQAIGATIVGAVLPAIATLGTSAPEEAALLAPKVSLGGRILRGAAQGAGYGAVQGASQARGGPEDYAREVANRGRHRGCLRGWWHGCRGRARCGRSEGGSPETAEQYRGSTRGTDLSGWSSESDSDQCREYVRRARRSVFPRRATHGG
jgi:hypothetical protein